jgi:hypothetical protein
MTGKDGVAAVVARFYAALRSNDVDAWVALFAGEVDRPRPGEERSERGVRGNRRVRDGRSRTHQVALGLLGRRSCLGGDFRSHLAAIPGSSRHRNAVSVAMLEPGVDGPPQEHPVCLRLLEIWLRRDGYEVSVASAARPRTPSFPVSTFPRLSRLEVALRVRRPRLRAASSASGTAAEGRGPGSSRATSSMKRRTSRRSSSREERPAGSPFYHPSFYARYSGPDGDVRRKG